MCMLGLSVRLLRFRSLVVDVPLLKGPAPMFLGGGTAIELCRFETSVGSEGFVLLEFMD